MDEVTDEPLYRDRVCGIDIGKAGLVATIRVPSEKNPARRAAETRSFGTTRREVLALEIVDAFLSATFEGGRHAARVEMIAALEG